MAGEHHAALFVGVTTAAASLVVPDGAATFLMKLLVALATGLVSGIAVKAGGALWNVVARTKDEKSRR